MASYRRWMHSSLSMRSTEVVPAAKEKSAHHRSTRISLPILFGWMNGWIDQDSIASANLEVSLAASTANYQLQSTSRTIRLACRTSQWGGGGESCWRKECPVRIQLRAHCWFKLPSDDLCLRERYVRESQCNGVANWTSRLTCLQRDQSDHRDKCRRCWRRRSTDPNDLTHAVGLYHELADELRTQVMDETLAPGIRKLRR